jgi:hypothetical protein
MMPLEWPIAVKQIVYKNRSGGVCKIQRLCSNYITSGEGLNVVCLLKLFNNPLFGKFNLKFRYLTKRIHYKDNDKKDVFVKIVNLIAF